MHRIQTVWPKWEGIEILGKGGFGTVYKAKREEFGNVEYSAIKVIDIPRGDEIDELSSSGFSNEDIKSYYFNAVVNLVDEIKLMGKFKSSGHIIGIEDYEVVEHKDRIGYSIFIRMELLTNISKYFRDNEMKVSDVVKMTRHILNALELCHNHHVVHRDIKPANIFISEFGDYKLGDFGVSREVERTNATMSQKGTKSYMAPEMIRMEKYSKNVDLYALGLTMYELLNHGRMPFLPPYPQTFFPIEREEAIIKRLSGEVFPDIEGIGDLNKIIKKACHFDAKERYQSASEMLNDLLDVKINNNDISDENDIKSNEILIDQIISSKQIDDQQDILTNDGINAQGLFDNINDNKKDNEPYTIKCPHCGNRAYKVFTNGYHCNQKGCYKVSVLVDEQITRKRKEAYRTYNKEKTLDAALELLKLDPHSEHAHIYVSRCYKDNNQLDKYKDYVGKALKTQSEDALTLTEMALYCSVQKDFEKAYYYGLEALHHQKNNHSSRIGSISDIYASLAIYAQGCKFSKDAFCYLNKAYQKGYNPAKLKGYQVGRKIGYEYGIELVEMSIIEHQYFNTNTINGRKDYVLMKKAGTDLGIDKSIDILYALGPIKGGLFSNKEIECYHFAFTPYDITIMDIHSKKHTFEYYNFDIITFKSDSKNLYITKANTTTTVHIGKDASQLKVLLNIIKNKISTELKNIKLYTLICNRCGQLGHKVYTNVFECSDEKCKHIFPPAVFDGDMRYLKAYVNYVQKAISQEDKLKAAIELTKLDPKSAHAYIYLSQEYLKSKVPNYKSLSYEALIHAYALESDDAFILNHMALYYDGIHDYSKASYYGNLAIKSQEKYRSTMPRRSDVYLNQAIYLSKLGQYKEGFELIRRAWLEGHDDNLLENNEAVKKIVKEYCGAIVKETLSTYVGEQYIVRDLTRVRNDLHIKDEKIDIYFAIEYDDRYAFAISSRGIEFCSDDGTYRTIRYWELTHNESFMHSGVDVYFRDRGFPRHIHVGQNSSIITDIVNAIIKKMGLITVSEFHENKIPLTLP